jgi:pilus assembly protein CpaE
MRAGARDVFSMPLNVEDLVAAVSRVADEERARGGAPSAHLAAFMNTKGGSGASFLAANTALAAARQEHRTILVDLDFQFGGLPTYLNMAVRNGLIKALELADGLDEASIDGYAQKHESGLHLLAAAMDEIILPDDVSRERIERLLGVLDQIYEDVIVDLPRRIDVPTATVLSRAEKVVLVAQQTVAHLHDTRRLAFLLRDQLGLPADRILLVLNRFDKKAEVRQRDFASILPGIAVETIPGDYRRVAESINLGVPVAQGGGGSALGKRLLDLTDLVTSHTGAQAPRGGARRGWLPWSTRR